MLLFFVPDAEIQGAVFAKWDGVCFQGSFRVQENGEKTLKAVTIMGATTSAGF